MKKWIAFSFALVLFISTAVAHAVNISLNIPGPNATSSGPGGLIANLYIFALLIAGILAFAVIVWGGVKYATSRGNPSAESDARSWITNALIGLLLLAAAYIVLYTVNPNLLNLQLPTITPVTVSPPASSGTGAGTSNGTTGTGTSGTGGS
jgi:hypothetical protein